MYKSELGNAKWITCALLADIGWLSFFAALSLCLVKKPEIMENKMVVTLLVMDLFSAALMLQGIVALMCEHLKKLDRVLTGKQLARGFGALTVGGALGMLFSLLAFAIALWNGLRGVGHLLALWGGGLLCGLCSGLILKEYRKI
jgi:hypothetical protein